MLILKFLLKIYTFNFDCCSRANRFSMFDFRFSIYGFDFGFRISGFNVRFSVFTFRVSRSCFPGSSQQSTFRCLIFGFRCWVFNLWFCYFFLSNFNLQILNCLTMTTMTMATMAMTTMTMSIFQIFGSNLPSTESVGVSGSEDLQREDTSHSEPQIINFHFTSAFFHISSCFYPPKK